MQPFENMKFRHTWRPYQARVIDAVHEHLDDKRLHVVAAPGAGKTTLGLEIFRLLGKPTLVLSPTRVIRDQWIERLQDFTEDEAPIDWVSDSLNSPKVLTSITYQSLHANLRRNEDSPSEGDDEESLPSEEQSLEESEVDCFIQTIKAHNIQVLILDEAHHLRSEWWKVLERVCQIFPDLVLVSLTATPPYDSQDKEWQRYEQLCGPIDEEISVPELVKAGTLCPHQDFVWICQLSEHEKQRVQEYDERVSALCTTLFDSPQFEDVVLSHPWLSQQRNESEITKDPQAAIALLVFIKAKSLPSNGGLMKQLDMRTEEIPTLGRRWWQVLIENILFSKTTLFTEEQQKFVDELKKQLRASELLRKRELSLERERRIERSLSLSSSKIGACAAIHKIEYKYRKSALRQVVLTDYIRDEQHNSHVDTGEVNLGALPVFEQLVSSSAIPDQLGLLTGRISVIPTQKLPLLLRVIESKNVTTEPFDQKGKYQKVSAPLNALTAAFTALLMQGDIKVLVGTRALLGEGWDAPAINSLILASTVGSFMLTNQMRGRAIRVDPNSKGKISSIWHLAAVSTKLASGSSDYYSLLQRFETFVGLSEKELTIESGYERIRLDDSRLLKPHPNNNLKMLRRFRRLSLVAERWHKAVTVDDTARVIPSVQVNKTPRLREYILNNSFSFLITQLVVSFFFTVIGILSRTRPDSVSTFFLLLGIASFFSFLYHLPKTITAVKVVIRYLPPNGALKQIGKAVAEALCKAGFIETANERLKVHVFKLPTGEFYISLSGCTFYESSLFSNCIREVLAPIESPRYILARSGTSFGLSKEDYHAVPMQFAVKKKLAQVFYESWQKHVCLSELIYTRTGEGRKKLLKAQANAFSSIFENEVKRQDRWQ